MSGLAVAGPMLVNACLADGVFSLAGAWMLGGLWATLGGGSLLLAFLVVAAVGRDGLVLGGYDDYPSLGNGCCCCALPVLFLSVVWGTGWGMGFSWVLLTWDVWACCWGLYLLSGGACLLLACWALLCCPQGIKQRDISLALFLQRPITYNGQNNRQPGTSVSRSFVAGRLVAPS